MSLNNATEVAEAAASRNWHTVVYVLLLTYSFPTKSVFTASCDFQR